MRFNPFRWIKEWFETFPSYECLECHEVETRDPLLMRPGTKHGTNYEGFACDGEMKRVSL